MAGYEQGTGIGIPEAVSSRPQGESEAVLCGPGPGGLNAVVNIKDLVTFPFLYDKDKDWPQFPF